MFKRLLLWHSERVVDRIMKVLLYCAAFVLVGMMLSETYEVVSRYFFNSPTIWASDVVILMVPVMTLLAAPWILKEGGHVRLEFVVEHLGAKGKVIMMHVVSAINVLVCALLCWLSGILALESYLARSNIYGAVVVPKYIMYIPLVIGFAFLCLEGLRQLIVNKE